MKIKFLGASGTVTGSSYVVTSDSGQSILIDLGMFQGTAEIEELNFRRFDYDTSKLSGAILTHAHLDHVGRLPLLLKGGFRGDIWMTEPTADLAELVLMDSAKIAKFEGNRALYDEDLAIKTIERFRIARYRNPIQLGDFNITFRDAGHILGSASIELIVKTETGATKLVFSGDLGNSPEPLVQETELIDSASIVVMESTYGNGLHPEEDPESILQAEINAIERDMSTLLVPAFSLERTQEVLHMVRHLKLSGKIKSQTPVYLDSPMATSATEIYMNYEKFLNSHIQGEMGGGGPFDFPGLKLSGSPRVSAEIRRVAGPQVIIAGSGMMNGGRIVGHAAHYLPQEKARLLLVGYQGDETLGKQLLEGKKEVVIDEKTVMVRASVNSTRSMSSHADQKQLLHWLGNIKGVKKVVLTHGEDDARSVFSAKVKTELGIEEVILPTLNQEIDF